MQTSNKIIIIGLIALALFGAGFFSSKKGGLVSKDTTVNNAGKLQKPKPQGPKVSRFDSNQINTLARGMHEAMLGSGTNEDLIFKTLRTLNPYELALVYKYFGLRRTYWRGTLTRPFADVDMVEWLRLDLSNSEFLRAEPYLIKAGLKVT